MNSRSTATTNLTIAAVTLALLLAYLPVRDLIPKGRGIGYDGALYAQWTRVLSLEKLAEVSTNRHVARREALHMDGYHVRRVLPSMTLHYVLRLLRIRATNPNIIAAFTAANILLLVIAVWCWCLAADEFRLGVAGKWIGFTALIVSYANWKMPFYYPVLTDTFALALGSAILLLYLRSRTLALALACIAGTFVWPTIPYFGALLIAFPYAPRQTAPDEMEAAPRWIPNAAAAIAALGTFALIESLLASYVLKSTPVEPMLPLSYAGAALSAGYVFLGLRALLDSRVLWESLDPRRLARSRPLWIACGFFAATLATVRALSLFEAPVTAEQFISDTFYTSATQPGIFYLAHVLYFGPLMAFIPVLWPPISREIRSRGTGLVLCFALALLISIGSESRKLINFFPVIVLFAAQAVERIASSPRRVLTLAALSLVVSKIWLPMDRGMTLPLLGGVRWRDLYVSSRGPWMSHEWYWLQLCLVLGLLLPVLWLWSRRTEHGARSG